MQMALLSNLNILIYEYLQRMTVISKSWDGVKITVKLAYFYKSSMLFWRSNYYVFLWFRWKPPSSGYSWSSLTNSFKVRCIFGMVLCLFLYKLSFWYFRITGLEKYSLALTSPSSQNQDWYFWISAIQNRNFAISLNANNIA